VHHFEDQRSVCCGFDFVGDHSTYTLNNWDSTFGLYRFLFENFASKVVFLRKRSGGKASFGRALRLLFFFATASTGTTTAKVAHLY
jgi:hypothetical protein